VQPFFEFIQIKHLVAGFLCTKSPFGVQFGSVHFFRLWQFLSDRAFVIVSPVISLKVRERGNNERTLE
jgi:hypothetical protein